MDLPTVVVIAPPLIEKMNFEAKFSKEKKFLKKKLLLFAMEDLMFVFRLSCQIRTSDENVILQTLINF